MDILESQNKEHGFYGTAALHGRRRVEAKWKAAFLWVAAAKPSWSPENIRDFLDGRPGRHLADELYCCGDMAQINPAPWVRTMHEFAVEVGIAEKTPGMAPRLQADSELRKAVAGIRKAVELYQTVLRQLPMEEYDTPATRETRQYAKSQIAALESFLQNR